MKLDEQWCSTCKKKVKKTRGYAATNTMQESITITGSP